RLGWFPWQLTALADLILGVALLRTSWVPRKAALVTLVLTVLAIIPDQVGQVLWMTRGVDLAAGAVRGSGMNAYLAFEANVFRMVGVFACIGYVLMALGWTWCFAAARTWSRWLTFLSVVTWGLFTAAVVFYFLPADRSPGMRLISFANAVGFILLLLWLVLVTDRVAGRCRPEAAHGRYAPWHHPGPRFLARA